jgi:hypothetical protein
VFRILLIALLAFGAWKGYEKYQSHAQPSNFKEYRKKLIFQVVLLGETEVLI